MPLIGSADPFGFTGELHDDNLVHLRARWYNPSLGTFTNRDPFAGFATLPYSQHPYQYAYSNPVLLTDPSGKFAPALAGSIAAGAGIGAGVEIGSQLYDQYRRTGRVDLGNLCAEDIAYAALSGAIAGGIGFFGGPAASAVFGRGLGGSIVAGAVEGAVSDMVVTAVTLTLRGEQVTADRMMQAAFSGALGGGVGGAIGRMWGPRRVTSSPMPKALLPAPVIRGQANSVGRQGPFSVTPEGTATALSKLPRRPGLPPRTDGGWERGQLTDTEFDFLRGKAQKFQKRIALAGSLSETDLGFQRRYDPQVRAKFPRFRRKKPESGLIDNNKGDLDFWEGSGLSKRELRELESGFPIGFEADSGYSLTLYPSLGSFANDAGALVFETDGSTWRVPATWQRGNWVYNDVLLESPPSLYRPN